MKKNLNIEFSVRRFAAQDILTASINRGDNIVDTGAQDQEIIYGDVQERNVFRYLSH